MENTLENKAGLFAQYIMAEPVCQTSNSDGILSQATYHLNIKHGLEKRYLLLKPISSITDEELLKLCSIIGLVNSSVYRGGNKDEILVKDDSYSLIIDKGSIMMYYRGKLVNDDDVAINDILRSFGIARDWMNLSVDQQIGYGWIKLL